MAGAILDSQLAPARTRRMRFDVATLSDDAEIRRLLRESPMPGVISLSFEREPDYFADAGVAGEKSQTIIAREHGRLVCVGSCAVRERFVNGRFCRVGYLGGLRLDSSVAGRFDIVRRGYRKFHELQAESPAEFYFTSIAADNARARNLLERGLPGMPAYEFIGEFVTLLVRVPYGSALQQTSSECFEWELDASSLITFLNDNNSRYQFAPRWSANELASIQLPGLQPYDFRVARNSGRIVACASLWDQRTFKQTVIRSYAPWLSRIRPVLNLAARFTNQPRLPGVGSTLAHAFVSHLAVSPSDPRELFNLVDGLRGLAAGRNLQCLTLGFATGDPRLVTIRAHFRGREYRSRIYAVHWPDIGGSAGDLDNRFLNPEVALL